MMQIRNLELSFPRFEHDGLRFLAFGSPALGGNRGEVTLFVPPDAENETSLPLVILLHGVYGTHWSWAFNGGAHRTAAALVRDGSIRPVVLAMPSDGLHGQGTGYLTLPSGDFERWIANDVPDAVSQALPCVDAVSLRFLAGFSMGGYGALRLGAKYSRYFHGISGHSSITDYDQFTIFVETPPPVPESTPGEELSVFHWMQKHRDQLPPIRFDCGNEDKLIEPNRTLHRRLNDEGIPHIYDEFEGTHSWAYWEQHLRETLMFFDRIGP